MKRLVREGCALVLSLAITFAVALAGMTTLSACGWFKSETKAVAAHVVDCAKQQLDAALLGDTIAAFAEPDWRGAITALIEKRGEDVLACAVRAAEADLTPPHGAAPSPAYSRARATLAERGWQFVQ